MADDMLTDASLHNGQPIDTGASCPSTGLASRTSPTSIDRGGVSVENVPAGTRQWFVLRVSYGRLAKANAFVEAKQMEYYVPLRYKEISKHGKRRIVTDILLSSFLFVRATRDETDALLHDSKSNIMEGKPLLSYYFDHTATLKNWLRSKNTLEYLGLWEQLNNPDFKGVEFDPLLKEAGSNAFTMSPTRWVELTNAIGIICKSGTNGGTFAQKDIAFKFASWVSVEFELYLIKEFQRLKEEEQKQIGWSAKRELSKINYRIHTDAIKANLIPAEVTREQAAMKYADEADVLNIAMLGMTARQWREQNPDKKGNIRDYATINELICLSNMENLNAVFINDGMPQSDRLIKLNQIAIQQMRIFEDTGGRNLLK